MEITTAEADFHGLSLFEWGTKKGLVGVLVFKPANVFDCEIVLSGGSPHAFTLTIPGKLSGGEGGLLIRGTMSKAPLTFELRLSKEQIEKLDSVTITVGFELSRWEGADLRRLPWISQITTFWRALFNAQKIGLDISVDGTRLP